MAYETRTEESIKEVAIGIHHGKIFTSQHCARPEDIRLVFMPLVFMEQEQLDSLVADKISVFFEYMSEAGSRSINGNPSFFSLQMLNEDDWARVFTKVEKLKELEAAI